MTIDFPDNANERELRLMLARAQFERHTANQVAALVDRTLNEVLDTMLSAKYRDLTANQRLRLQQLYAELDRTIKAGYAQITDDTVKRMQAYSQLESDVTRATVNAVLKVGGGDLTVSFYRLPKDYLTSIANLPVDGLKIGDWFEGQARGLSQRSRQTIQKGMLEGKGPVEFARQILAPDKAMGPALPPALSKRARNEAKAITRTIVNTVQNDATRQSYRKLPASVSDSYMITAVRDSRTSAICRAKDGLVFRYDDPNAEYPAFHIGCRTTTRALIKGVDVSLTDQKVSPTLGTYASWLKRQSDAVQNDILGPTRAQFFRDGKMSLADAIDQDNRVLTLPQLRTKLGLDAVAHA